MAQTSPQMRLETVEPPRFLLISIHSRLIEAKEMSALGQKQT